jgi:hypothetical protein
MVQRMKSQPLKTENQNTNLGIQMKLTLVVQKVRSQIQMIQILKVIQKIPKLKTHMVQRWKTQPLRMKNQVPNLLKKKLILGNKSMKMLKLMKKLKM